MKQKAKELISRILRENEEDVAQAKLGDIAATLVVARAGRPVIIPASWDDDQRELWKALANYHGFGKEVS